MHVLVVLLLSLLQDGKQAILPEMVVKRARFPNVQPFHDGKAHRIAIAEVLVLIVLNDFPGPPFVFLYRADDVGASGDGRPQKVLRPCASQTGQDQRVRFGKDEIGGEEEPVFPARPLEQARRVAVMGISAVEGGIEATRVHKDAVHS
jgi:hypothetical protein